MWSLYWSIISGDRNLKKKLLRKFVIQYTIYLTLTTVGKQDSETAMMCAFFLGQNIDFLVFGDDEDDDIGCEEPVGCDHPHKCPMHIGFQEPATMEQWAIWNFHHDLMIVLVFVIIFVGLFLDELITMQVRRTDEAIEFKEPLITRDNLLEIVWTVVPTLILVIILWPTLGLIYALESLLPCLLTMKVIGHQWYWSYEYNIEFDAWNLFSDQKESDFIGVRIFYDSYVLNDEELGSGFRLLSVDKDVILPVHINSRVLITSADVIHSWAVPSFGLKLDACPGRLNFTIINCYREGVFYGQCSELCGVNHGFMPIGVSTFWWSEWIWRVLDYYFLELVKWTKQEVN